MPTAAERYNFAEVEKDGKTFISEMFKLCNVHGVVDNNKVNMLKIGTKDVLATQLVRALELIERQHNLIINQRVHVSTYQSDIIQLQSDVIDAQRKSIQEFKNDVIGQLSETVKDTVQSGFSKSYSEAAKSYGTSSPNPIISQDTLKTVAKQVVVEEELSRNIMLFGLPEEDNEQLCAKVSEVFEHLDAKPRVEASRLGIKKSKSAAVRPVKVTLSSSTIVQHILVKSRNLRLSEKYKTVFLSPDRTAEQRAQQRELVLELKKKAAADPLKRHFLKGGRIHSVDK